MATETKIQRLQSRIASDPFDTAAWEQLLGEVSRGKKSDEHVAKLREIYEDLLSKFPTAVSLSSSIPTSHTPNHLMYSRLISPTTSPAPSPTHRRATGANTAT